MSDKNKLLALLTEFGVEPKISEGFINGQTEVCLAAHEGGVIGYTGFECVFTFDENDKFIDVGVWE